MAATAVDYTAAQRGVRVVLDEAIAEAHRLRADLEDLDRDLANVLDGLKKLSTTDRRRAADAA